MISILLQAAPEATKFDNSLWGMWKAGGWTMYPILALFILAIIIFVERFLTLRKYNQDPTAFMANVKSYVLSGNLEGAKQACLTEGTPYARMILKGIHRLGSPLRDIASAIENVGNMEASRLEKRMGLLATVAGAAPMLGFLGTVSGLIGAFSTISEHDSQINPGLLAGDIGEAMITTFAGLVVGISAYLAYNTLVNMVTSIVDKMEASSTDFIDLLQEPAH